MHHVQDNNNNNGKRRAVILCVIAVVVAGTVLAAAMIATTTTTTTITTPRDINAAEEDNNSTGAVSANNNNNNNHVSNNNNNVTLFDPEKKEIAMQLVSSAENSSTDWRAQYAYIEDISDNRGYTGGIIGFTSGTSDMLMLIQYYTQIKPDNILAKYIPALNKVVGTASHEGLDPTFVADWQAAADNDPVFRQAQDHERDVFYFNPSVKQAQDDGLGVLGQFIYYDAMVMHGPGDDPVSFGGIRAAAMAKAKTPAQGGNETVYLNAFLDARKAAMAKEAARWNTSRIDTEQRVFLQQGNLDLSLPLRWQVSGDTYTIYDRK